MSLPVKLTPEAEADLQEAGLWYDQRSAGLGARLVAKVREALTRLGNNPSLYPEVHQNIRQAPVKRFPYGVFYRQLNDRVEVIAVFHDRRDPSIWLNRV